MVRVEALGREAKVLGFSVSGFGIRVPPRQEEGRLDK